MTNYLFTLTITPVQSFISQARKTKDLFAGSEILSNLMKQVLKKSNDLLSSNIEIIFPYIKEIKKLDNVSFPNKIVCKIKNSDKHQIEKIGDNLTKCINKECINLVFEHTGVYDRFYENFFQVFWVAVELEDDNYEKSYKKLEQNLGAVKNLRTFRQQKELEGARKCSLCGERNGTFYKRDKKGRKPKYISTHARDIEKNNIHKIDTNQIKTNETLCAICFTKRFYKGSYPSLAKITLLDWLKDVDYIELKDNITNFDEELFFDDNLNSKYLEKVEVSSNAITKIKKFIKENNLDTSKQKKYYALIQFDIDDMGKKLSSLDKDGQKKLSKELKEFAQKAKEIVNKGGKTIYAGGDDFLGFVNLKYLFIVTKCITKVFRRSVISKFPDITFSTSIVIAHYKTPLNKVLNYSRTTLQEVKNRFENPPKAFNTPKNAVAVTYITKSNNLSTSYFYRDRFETFVRLNQLLKDEITPKLSSKFIFNMAQEFRKFGFDTSDIDSIEIDLIIDMMNIELKRLLKRASADFDTNINEKKKRLQKLYIGLSEYIYDNWNDNKKFDFENYMMFFKVAELMNGER